MDEASDVRPGPAGRHVERRGTAKPLDHLKPQFWTQQSQKYACQHNEPGSATESTVTAQSQRSHSAVTAQSQHTEHRRDAAL